jgi:hypothetical protein
MFLPSTVNEILCVDVLISLIISFFWGDHILDFLSALFFYCQYGEMVILETNNRLPSHN